MEDPKTASTRQLLEAAVTNGVLLAIGPEASGVDPLVRPTQEAKFGDFQANVALPLAKQLRRSPMELARAIAASIDVAEMCEPPEVAPPGFINFRLRPAYVSARLNAIYPDGRLGIPKEEPAQTVAIDFSSPTLAKEMHVGHLRSTIIGDTIARLLEFQGHSVLRLNHVGDWGTQFGMLIQHVREAYPHVLDNPEQFHVADLEEFYREAKSRFDSDPRFAEAARRAVVELQSGEPVAQLLWSTFCRESLQHCHEIYERLGVSLIDRGESFYNYMLPEVVDELRSLGLAVDHEGAVCIFLEGWTNREGNPQPMIVRKSDGGYNYDTTDLAAVKHRIATEGADRIIYVTDVRQQQHFEMVFAAARKAGWVPTGVEIDHVGFGMVLGPDRRPFKTREGGTVKLKGLLDEAESRALTAVSGESDRRQDLTEDERREVARIVGIGAVKYADLSHNLASDYLFDWDTMLSMEGNTAPYMLYAYARIRSIMRRASVQAGELQHATPIVVEHETEIALGKQLLALYDVLLQVSASLRPHFLTDYLYSLARAFSAFYERDTGVRVIDAPDEALRISRLKLCDLTARTLRLCLWLLGIHVVEKM